MSIKRVERKSLLGNIKVNTSSSSANPVGDVIVNAANSFRSRALEIANDQAQESGKSAAADLDLNSITRFNPNSQLPVAIDKLSTLGLGTLGQEAFEDAVLLRFKTAMQTKMASKADEIKETVKPEKNAPELFVDEYKNYLEGLAGDSSGYYKQFIIDQGTQYLEVARTELDVARIQRIQNENAQIKDELISKANQAAYNHGFNGNFVDAGLDQEEMFTNLNTFKAIKITDDEEEKEVLEGMSSFMAKGALDAILQDPKNAVHAETIFQYFSSMGNQTLLRTLPLDVRDSIKSIKNIFGPNNPALMQKLASDNVQSFESAKKTGEIITADIIARDTILSDALKNMEIERQTNKENSIETYTLELQNQLNDEYFRSLGATANAATISKTIQQLNNSPEALDSSVVSVGKEKHSALMSVIEKAKDSIVEGLIEDLMRTPDGIKNAEEIKFILGRGDYKLLRSVMKPLKYNLLMKIGDSSNSEKLAKIASSVDQLNKKEYDKNQIQEKTSLTEAILQLTIFAQNNNSTSTGIESRLESLIKAFPNVLPKNQAQLASGIKEINKTIQAKRKEENTNEFQVNAHNIVMNTNSSNLTNTLALLKTNAKQFSVDPETLKIEVQKAVNMSVKDQIANIIDGPATQEQLDLLQTAMSYFNPEIQSQTPRVAAHATLVRKIQTIINEATTVSGMKFKGDQEEVYKQLQGAFKQAKQTYEADEAKFKLTQDLKSLQHGIHNDDFYTADGKNKLMNLYELQFGQPLNDELFHTPLEELTGVDRAVLDFMANADGANIPKIFQTSIDAFMQGNLNPSQTQALFMNFRELAIKQSASGRITFNTSFHKLLGNNQAAELITAFEIYSLLREKSRDTEIYGILQLNKQKLNQEDFKDYTGFSSPTALLNKISALPSPLHDEFVPIVRAMAPYFETGTKDALKNIIKQRFETENANLYSVYTGSSVAPNDYGTGKQMEGIEHAIAMYIPKLGGNRYFDVDATVAVEDLAGGTSFGQLIKDTKSNLTDEISKLRTQNRVIYGPTLQSSAENPEYMLYEIVNETGYVRPIPNTTFTKNTPWVKEGLAAYAEKLEKERAERAPFIIPLLGAATGPIPEGIINE